MLNRGILACCLVAILLVSTVTVTTTVVPVLANESSVIMKILDNANTEANNKLQELQQKKGVEIPQHAESLHSAALSEREAARQAFERGDTVSAPAHAIMALDLFKNLFDLLATLELQHGAEDDSGLVDAIDQDISNSQRWADNLRRLTVANNISVSFSRYDSAINASADALSEGNLEEAAKQFDLAQELSQDIHDDIQQAVQADRGKSEKAREFAMKTANRLGNIIADLRKDSSSDDVQSELIPKLGSMIAQLGNATDIEKIIEITDDSSELQRIIDQYNAYRVENFEVQYVEMQEDIAALLAAATALNIRIQSSEIDLLLSGAREKVQAGQEDNAAEELDRLDSLLDEIEDIVQQFTSVIEEIAQTRIKGQSLRSEAANDAGAMEEIGRAIALLERADSAVKVAAQVGIGSETIRDANAQIELASRLTQDANDILDAVEGDLEDPQDRRPEAGMKTIG